MAVSDVVWEALAMGRADLVEAMDLSMFNWQASHPNFGSPLHAVLFGKTKPFRAGDDEEAKTIDRAHGWGHLLAPNDHDAESRLALLQFVLDKGADPAAIPQGPCQFALHTAAICEDSGIPCAIKKFDFSRKVPAACLMAIVRAAHKQTTPDQAHHNVQIILDDALEILCSASNSGPMTRNTLVHTGFINVCKAHAADDKSHDVAIVVQGENGAAQESLTAHSGMLCATSEVLKAMLCTNMSEGLQKRITLPDVSKEAVELFLHISYTGQISMSDVQMQRGLASVATLLGSLQLAHRWQALHVVHVVVVALKDRVGITCLLECLEVALRLNVLQLRAVCITFALRNALAVREMLEESGETSNANARAELDRVVIKKRRLS